MAIPTLCSAQLTLDDVVDVNHGLSEIFAQVIADSALAF
jgi:hypothetical protein